MLEFEGYRGRYDRLRIDWGFEVLLQHILENTVNRSSSVGKQGRIPPRTTFSLATSNSPHHGQIRIDTIWDKTLPNVNVLGLFCGRPFSIGIKVTRLTIWETISNRYWRGHHRMRNVNKPLGLACSRNDKRHIKDLRTSLCGISYHLVLGINKL